MMKPKLGDQAKGKWPSILPKLGVEERFLTGRHGPCPLCAPGGAGTDRFRFDNKDGRGSWFCSQCGAGDGIELVKRANGWDFKRAAPEIEALLGTARVVAVRHGRDVEEVRKEMNAIWRGAKPIREVEPAALWWMRRVGSLPECPDLRAVRSLRCPGAGDFPAMVALIRDADGKPANLHRTFLSAEGWKADIAEPRRVMDIQLPRGSAVRLTPEADVLGIAEGLETAESARILFGVPTWAALNAGNMAAFTPPQAVRRLVIFGELDASFTGQAATFDLARKLWAARKRWSPDLEIDVRINGVTVDPGAINSDWNDVLQARLGKQMEPA